MSWNYRILVSVEHGEEVYSVHEVYYDKKGKPNGYIENKNIMNWDSKKSIKWTLKKIKEAMKKPLLSKQNFPKKYKKK